MTVFEFVTRHPLDCLLLLGLASDLVYDWSSRL